MSGINRSGSSEDGLPESGQEDRNVFLHGQNIDDETRRIIYALWQYQGGERGGLEEANNLLSRLLGNRVDGESAGVHTEQIVGNNSEGEEIGRRLVEDGVLVVRDMWEGSFSDGDEDFEDAEEDLDSDEGVDSDGEISDEYYLDDYEGELEEELLFTGGINRAGMAEYIRSLPSVSEYVRPKMDNELADIIQREFSSVKCSDPSAAVSPAKLLQYREIGFDGNAAKSTRSIAVSCMIPDSPSFVIDRMESRGYIGRFTADGDLFIAAYQNDRKIKFYDVHSDFAPVKSIYARNLQWTVTDTDISPDGKFLIYSSISPTVHLVNVGKDTFGQESVANVTDIHEPLHFANEAGSLGLWSIRWSGDGKEILAGTSNHSIVIYDVETQSVVSKAKSHMDDVNAVAYADNTNHTFFSGSDDSTIHIWDRRTMGRQRGKPVGAFIGHTQGIAYMDSKGDSTYIVSNSKDQTAKCWDLRIMTSMKDAMDERKKSDVPTFRFDYRWMSYPANGKVVSHPRDVSVSTYRGHSVIHTLCRVYWSPLFTTGQKYIYAACASGSIFVYDVISGDVVKKLKLHVDTVRDCSWHPYLPLIGSVSFDGRAVAWEPRSCSETF